MTRALSLALALALAVPALAEPRRAPPEPAAPKPAARPTSKPPPTLDELFERLAKARDAAEAGGVARLIERRWMRSGSDTADLLMSRAIEAMKADDPGLAVELLDRVIARAPGWAEAWNRRATAFFMQGDRRRSLADIRETLAREPRHFGALSGLGVILLAEEDKRRAYDAFKRALAVHPHLHGARESLDRLAPEVEGRDI